MRATFIVVSGLWTGLALVLVSPVQAEEFKWSWEEEPAGAEKPAEPAPAPATTPQPLRPPPRGVDVSKYEEIVRENIELRRELTHLEEKEQALRKEKARLAQEAGGLEQNIAELSKLVRDLRKAKAAPSENVDRVVDLESQLAAAEEEKAKMAEALKALRQRIREAEQALPPAESGAAAAPVGVVEEDPLAPPAEPAMTSAIQPGSDLYRQIEEENRRLREKLASLDAERQKAERARARLAEEEAKAAAVKERAKAEHDEIEGKLKQARESEKRYRDTVEKLLKDIPALEGELNELRLHVDERDGALADRERHLEDLKRELRRREDRLTKAERMITMMEDAREDVRRIDSAEKRDMHFNMAAVYAKEGRFRDAEREYLRALDIDPADADVHYNLGILYDDELKNKRRAAMHYRKYLRLRPHGADFDKVKGWLMDIEMASGG